MQSGPNSGSLQDGRSDGYTTLEAGTQTSSTDSKSAGPDWRKIGRADLEIVRNEPIYERPVVKRGGADFVSQGSRTSPSPSASVDLAHLRPVRGRFSVHPATHPLSLRPREIAPPQCR